MFWSVCTCMRACVFGEGVNFVCVGGGGGGGKYYAIVHVYSVLEM